MTYIFNKARHAHTTDGKPLMGTTTLINEMMPPPLAWWASGMALAPLGWINKRINERDLTDEIRKEAEIAGARITGPDREGKVNIPDKVRLGILLKTWAEIREFTTESFLSLLDKAYRNHDSFKKEAGGWGTEKHDLIEQAVKEAIDTNGGYLYEGVYEDEAVERFAKWGRGKRFIHSEVHVYSETLWVGGIVDLVYEEGGQFYLGDVKTARSGLKPSQFFQMGLYDLQQGENGFVDETGVSVGGPLEISGYTVVPIPKDGHFDPKTYYDTTTLKTFGKLLVEGYKIKRELEAFCQ